MSRVLVVTRNFPPLWGGMERLNQNLVAELSRYFEVRLVAPHGAADHVSETIPVTAVQLRPLSSFLVQAAFQAVRQSLSWKPDVVFAGSGLVAPLALLAARLVGAKAVVYAHGLDLAVSHPVYRAVWRPALRQMDGVIANSSPTRQLARNIGIAQQRISVVHPGVSIPVCIDSAAGARFRAAHGLGSGPILLSVGRLTSRKGLREFVSEVLPRVVSACPDVRLVIIGDEPTDSLYAEGQSVHSIQAAAEERGVGKHIHFLGKRFGDELADAYMAADIHVFPVRQIPGDPEGFGMVAVEAAAYGLPTVGYATGGVVDAVSDGVSGRLIPPGNSDDFTGAVIELLGAPMNSEGVRGFSRKFAWSLFGDQIASVLRNQG